MICFHIRSTFSSNILDFKIKVGKQKFRFRYLIDKQLKFALNEMELLFSSHYRFVLYLRLPSSNANFN